MSQGYCVFIATRVAPFESLQIVDIGGVPINTFNLQKSIDIIEDFYSNKILAHDAIPLPMGGGLIKVQNQS